MTTPNTNTHSAMDACPPLEDIAAFIDGMLPAAERERMTAHLARCESCYEIFAGAVEFQEESSAEDITRRDVLPFPLVEPAAPVPAPAVPLARRKTRWFPLAASIALTAGVGFFAWQALRPPEITLDAVAEGIEGQSDFSELLYNNAMRGGGQPSSMFLRPEFMTGVYLLDLRLGGSSDATGEPLRRLDNELQQIYGWPQDSGAEVGQRDLRKLEADVQEYLADSPSFAFGLWAEAGRLSAATRSPEFFEDRDNRRFLSQIQKDLPEDLREQVLGDLQTIESRWGKDFSALQTSFGSIIKAIDGYEEEFPAE